MALPPSGPISMSQINTELSVPATTLISLNQSSARALAQVPAGMISLSNFYGKSTGVAKAFTWSFWGNYVAGGPANGRVNSYDIWQCDFATETVSLAPTVNSPTLWYGGYASTADKIYQIAGLNTRPATPPLTTVSNRIDTINYSTIARTSGVGTTAYPLRQANSGYDSSTYIYTLAGIGSPSYVNTGFRTNINTNTSSPTTSWTGSFFAPATATQGIRDANRMVNVIQTAPPSPSPYAFIPFSYATQTYGASLGLQNRSAAFTNNKFAISKAGFAYANFGGFTYSVKYNLSTFTNTVSPIGTVTPLNTLTQASNFNEGTNWVAIYGGLTGGSLSPRNYKLTYATDTFIALPNLPLIFGTNNTNFVPANCDQPISYSY